MEEYVDSLCLAAREHAASDLFLHEGRVPHIRLGGQIMEIGDTALPAEAMETFWSRCGGTTETQDRDTSFVASDGGRFRVSLFRNLGQRGAVLRQIKTEVPDLATLGLPAELLTEWVSRPAGLVLVTGRTGSGKSTTLAAMLDWLNQNAARHVVTIEDPIEYLFQPNLCLFSQREVGLDTDSFADGLRHSLRQSPDVILVGEIRDAASALTALHAAETGHLVMATLHSSTVAETLERFVQLFGTDDRESAKRVLASMLIGVACQRLIPTKEEGGQVPALELLQNEGASRKIIIEGRFPELSDLLLRGGEANVSFLTSLAGLVRDGVVHQETAMEYCDNAHELSRALRGISSGTVSR